MSQQQRVVQLSPASLALVFGKDEESSRTAGGKYNASSASGREIFADFKSQNTRSFWNKRLVKAMAEVYFQGWMENFVLIVQGNANHLEVVREAWMRRALRSPRGFNIRAVGDLSPMQMAPIVQSQFIPLSEVLCSVISDMNAAQVTVSQEALFSHMMKAYPGMTIPTQDILYNALGSLIKERKIYHTGEGYFIVTPQTYFITNSVVKDKHWWTSGENDLPSPPPITYLLSSESCMDSTADPPSVAHCKSCSCFAPSVLDQHSVAESTAKSLRWPRDPKPSIQHQSTSTATHYQPSEMSKSTTSRKDKEKPGRKFGLSFFRRNVGKKEKPKKEYATYSGQFPPAEWPVRDEEDLNNLPRDLEHAIIRRINPELTVDNLVRHTVLMKKLEDKGGDKGGDKGVDRGVSTEILTSKQRHPSAKVPGKRSSSRAARSKRKTRSSREKQREKMKDLGCPADPDLDHIPSLLGSEVAVDEPVPQAYEHSSPVDTKNVFKKRIDNPFQGRPVRKPEESRQTGDSREHAGHRSKSWDPSQTKKSTNRTGRPVTTIDRSCEALTLDSQPVKELLGDYSSGYPETSTLRIEDKMKKLTESKARGRALEDDNGKGTKHKASQDGNAGGRLHPRHPTRQAPHKDSDLMAYPLPPQITHQSSTAASPFGPNTTAQHRLGLSAQQLDGKGDVKQSLSHCGSQQHTPQPLKSGGLRVDSGQTESDSCTDEDQALYQRAVEDDDACSSLYLNEDSMNEGSDVSQSERIPFYQQSSTEGDRDCAFLEEVGVHQGPVLGTSQQVDCRWHELNSQRHSVVSQTDGAPAQAPQVPLLPGGEAEPNEVVQSCIFDRCQGSEADSDTETLHRSADEAESRSFSWGCGPRPEELEHQGAAGSPRPAAASQGAPAGAGAGEAVENHSSTGDSGIDSPRTRVSLTSSSSGIVEGLKQRIFLQDLETLHSMRPQNSVLQLASTMNV
ncbi:storkhead-box protein 1 [Anguilla anguilla]|uniref:storkhead-box protein 1 n=1 Tax=Anguilla anguilla TaxID=7936 RepID=UPI0015AB6835|nr:storkhead-box protein 1 [Anguilla anguilla]